MAVSTATLGGVTLPDVEPEGFDESYGYRGSDRLMMDGSVNTDLVTTTAKRVFELRWWNLTETQVNTLKTAFATVRDSSATFVTPLGASVTVTRDVGRMSLEINWHSRRRNPRATVSMALREV